MLYCIFVSFRDENKIDRWIDRKGKRACLAKFYMLYQ